MSDSLNLNHNSTSILVGNQKRISVGGGVSHNQVGGIKDEPKNQEHDIRLFQGNALATDHYTLRRLERIEDEVARLHERFDKYFNVMSLGQMSFSMAENTNKAIQQVLELVSASLNNSLKEPVRIEPRGTAVNVNEAKESGFVLFVKIYFFLTLAIGIFSAGVYSAKEYLQPYTTPKTSVSFFFEWVLNQGK